MKKVGTITLKSMENKVLGYIVVGIMLYKVTKADGRKKQESMRWKVGLILDTIEAVNFMTNASLWGGHLDMSACKTGEDFRNDLDRVISIEVDSIPGIHEYSHEFECPSYYLEEINIIQ